MSDKKQKLYSWLREDGFSHAAASGIIGNVSVETGDSFSPRSDQANGPGRGIAQWSEGERWDALVSWAQKQGKDPENLRTQYEYMLKEMRSGIFGFQLDQFKRMTNARQAADYFDSHFEKSWAQDDEERRDRAQAARKDLKGADMPTEESSGPSGGDLVKIARKGLGVPYVGSLGPGASPKTGWDCASFMGWVLRQAGYKNPPTFSEDFIDRYDSVKGWRGKGPGGVNRDNLQPGDIIVYRAPGSNGAGANGHVAMYVGNGKVIEAASRAKGTQIGSLWYSGSKPIVAVVRPAKSAGGAQFSNSVPGRYGESREDKMLELLGISDDFLNMKDAKGNLVNQDIEDLLNRAVDEKWSESKFRNEFRNSKWYQARNESMRKFDMMSKTDREDLLAKSATGLDVLSGNMGVGLTEKQRRNIAFKIARNGLDENMTALILSRKYRPKDTETGEVSVFQNQIEDLANNYGYKVSKKDMEQWTRDHLAGRSTYDGYEETMRDWAQSRVPFLDLDGKTLRTALSQYVNSGAQELGMDADEIDLSQDQWVDVYDQEKKRMLTSQEWGQKVRTDKRFNWENSEMGATVGRNLASALAAAFGKV